MVIDRWLTDCWGTKTQSPKTNVLAYGGRLQVIERSLGIFMRTHGRKGLKFGELYRGNHQNWLDFVQGLLIFLFLAQFWLNNIGQIRCYSHFLDNAQEEWPEFCMLIYPGHLQSRLDFVFCFFVWWFSSFWRHFGWVKQTKCGVSGHCLEIQYAEWPEIWHIDISWPPSALIRFWP